MDNLMIRFAMMVAEGDPSDPNISKVFTEVGKILHTIFSIVFGLVGAIVVCFAIYLVFKFVKADDESKRTEAKKQLLWTLIAIVGIVIMIGLFYGVLTPQLLQETGIGV